MTKSILELLSQRRQGEDNLAAAGRYPLPLRSVGCFLKPEDYGKDMTLVGSALPGEWENEVAAYHEKLRREGPFYIYLMLHGVDCSQPEFPQLLKTMMDAHPNGPPQPDDNTKKKPSTIMQRHIGR